MERNKCWLYNVVCLVVVWGVLWGVAANSSYASEGATLRIGVLAHRGVAEAKARWTPTAEYLAEEVPGFNYVVVPFDNDSLWLALKRQKLDFVLTNPASYAMAEAEFGISRLVTLRNRRNGGEYIQFGALILTRSDREDISSLQDLRGKSFMAVHPEAFGGWWMAWKELLDHGIDPYENLSKLEFGGFPQDKIVFAIRDGEVDAGTVRTDILESMARSGIIKRDEFRILNEQFTPGFPFSHSTKLYPEWPFSASKSVDRRIAKKVALALLNMPAGSRAAIAAGIEGWTVPLDYQPVHQLMSDLKVGPYKHLRQVSFSQVWKQYYAWFLTTAILILSLVFLVIKTKRLNRKLTISKIRLTRQVKERKKAEDKSATLGKLIDRSASEIIVFDRQNLGIIQVNEGLQRNTGIPMQELLSMTFLDLQKDMDIDRFLDISSPLLDNDIQQTNFEARFVRADESRYFVEVWMQLAEISGRPVFMAVCEDVTARKLAERAIHEAQQKAEVTLESIADAVITADIRGNITYINTVAEQLTGWSKNDARGMPLTSIAQLVFESTNKVVPDPVTRCIETGGYSDIDNSTLLLGRNGKSTPVQQSVTMMRDIDGNAIGIAMVLRNITDLYRLQTELQYFATHDDLTRLINRREFQNRLSIALNAVGNRKTDSIALLYLDLDQFKVINDNCGHSAGDELLKQLALQLHQSVRASDIVARLGGDEFAILLESGCDKHNAEDISKKIIKMVNEYRFSWQDKIFQIGVSIGIVLIKDSNREINEVLAMADSACYVAKDLGRNRYYIYNATDETLLKHRNEMQWVQQIKHSLELNKFCLYAQPLKPLSGNGATYMHEILLRMIDSDGELVLPELFIGAAERYQLMHQIDRWVIRSTFRFISEYCSDRCARQRFAINVSGQSISDMSFADFVKREFNVADIKASNIIFEITETSAISHYRSAVRFIEVMQEMGCLFALDDFGSGMSSFSYLKNLAANFLKIDGSFVTGIAQNREDFVMVKTMHQIGHSMGMQTIAEFVENEEILEKLHEIGIDFAQGYSVGPPRPLAEYLPWLYSSITETSESENADLLYKKA